MLAAASAMWVCACTVPASPTSPSAVVTARPVLAAASTADGFEASFYRAFLQNGFESPDRLEPIRTLPGPLRIYLRTNDESGRAIDALTLESTERTLRESAVIWSGETFGVAEVARGAGTREKMSGWITVKWATTPSFANCGRSTVGVDGGFIELNSSGSCSCGLAARVYPRLVRHELGHAMGYYHTDDANDVMSSLPVARHACDALPSERERRHAKIAYRRSQ